MRRDPEGLALRRDPLALAPERLLVFEIRGDVANFSSAVQRVQGLEWVDEEELAEDEFDTKPVAYLMVPDSRALKELVSLWARWQNGERLGTGFAPWEGVFSLLRDLRAWGPSDRVDPRDAEEIRDELASAEGDIAVRLEVELVFRSNERHAGEAEASLRQVVEASGGSVIAASRIAAIAYHATLVELPNTAVRQILDLATDSIAGVDSVMHIRPQSLATELALAEVESSSEHQNVDVGPLREPILGLLDGVPVAAHALLRGHLIVDDVVGLEERAQVQDRAHGTAMASLIVHGDRNADGPPLPRRVHVVPVVAPVGGGTETFPDDRLIVDVVYQAILAMRDGEEPAAPNVIIVNLSLGNRRKRFHSQMSAWARLLDFLAYKYGILFVVSAGNVLESFGLDQFGTLTEFEDSDPDVRANAVVEAIGNVIGERKIISPAESVNAVTVGASNQNSVPDRQRRSAAVLVDPYLEVLISNPSSALGPGFGNSVKPDILLPGGRERLSVIRSGNGRIELRPGPAGIATGLRVAAPPRGGQENAEGYTAGTSAAAAIASRTSHRIHDALEREYGEAFTGLPASHRASLLKALLCHTASWPQATADLIVNCLGPHDPRQYVRRKDNVRRFIGYGIVDPDSAAYCADDRATFWATGELRANEVVIVPVPIPAAMGGQAVPHEVRATVAWISPVRSGSKAYRSVRLTLLEPKDVLPSLGIAACSSQPDSNQIKRGTLLSRRWVGERAAAVSDDMLLRLKIQREPDAVGSPIDEPIPFGIAVTLSMPGVNGIYAEVRERLRPRARAGSG